MRQVYFMFKAERLAGLSRRVQRTEKGINFSRARGSAENTSTDFSNSVYDKSVAFAYQDQSINRFYLKINAWVSKIGNVAQKKYLFPKISANSVALNKIVGIKFVDYSGRKTHSRINITQVHKAVKKEFEAGEFLFNRLLLLQSVVRMD
jgi:hypothetical protein